MLFSSIPQRDGAHGWELEPRRGQACWQRCHGEQSSRCEFPVSSSLVFYLPMATLTWKPEVGCLETCGHAREQGREG